MGERVLVHQLQVGDTFTWCERPVTITRIGYGKHHHTKADGRWQELRLYVDGAAGRAAEGAPLRYNSNEVVERA